jgi:hypothetical protein
MNQRTAIRAMREAPPVVHDVLRSPGRLLDSATRAYMEPRFGQVFSSPGAAGGLRIVPPHDASEREAHSLAAGFASARVAGIGHDFSRVRVHADARAATSAAAVNARAYTVGSDIVFGHGQYAPSTVEGRRLLAHELVHTLQQRSGPVLQRDVVSDAEKKLSYAWNDWAITDDEATEALALLGTIPQAQLPADLKRLGSKYVVRLLDNLPETAKSGEIYKRVIEALGPSGILPYARSELKTGFWDWWISDAEVTRVFKTFANLPQADHENFLAALDDAKRLDDLIDNSNAEHHSLYIVPWLKTLPKGSITPRQIKLLRVIVQNSGDALDTVKLATEIRFNVNVGPSTLGTSVKKLDVGRLRQTYLILDRLPEAHVAKNKELRSITQFTEPATVKETSTTISGSIVAGMYNAGAKELTVNVENLPTKLEEKLTPEQRTHMSVETTVVHETGHAVDAEMGWSSSAEPATSARGGWTTYASHRDCATDMVTGSADGIKNKLTAPQQADVVQAMRQAMGKRSTAALESDIRALPWFGGLSKPDQAAVTGDRALGAVSVGLDEPYFRRPDGGERLGNHIYQQSYAPTWVRYEHVARARLLSPYQFRNAGEWFAEAYAFYYTPDLRPTLDKKDPNTKTYFDTNVATRAPTR